MCPIDSLHQNCTLSSGIYIISDIRRTCNAYITEWCKHSLANHAELEYYDQQYLNAV